MSTFDRRYGIPVFPGYVRGCEQKFVPKTRALLCAATATVLAFYMNAIKSEDNFGKLLFSEIPFLWLVSEDGEIFVAFEEVVVIENGRLLFPKPKKAELSTATDKLGHPSLVSGRAARIGGEIYYEDRGGYRCWVLTNQSGRYGLNREKSEELLVNVASEFKNFGIVLRPVAV